VSPVVMPVTRSFDVELEVPDNKVEPVITAAVVLSSFTTVPVTAVEPAASRLVEGDDGRLPVVNPNGKGLRHADRPSNVSDLPVLRSPGTCFPMLADCRSQHADPNIGRSRAKSMLA
jgi:hypothetical protein